MLGLRPSLLELKEKVNNFQIGTGSDTIGWRWGSYDIFSVRSLYRMLRDMHTKLIWRLRIPLKVKVYSWLVLKKRATTVENLVKRGWTSDKICVLYRIYKESVDHLFTQRVFVKFLMIMGIEDVRARELGDEVHVVWARWQGRNGNSQ